MGLRFGSKTPLPQLTSFLWMRECDRKEGCRPTRRLYRRREVAGYGGVSVRTVVVLTGP